MRQTLAFFAVLVFVGFAHADSGPGPVIPGVARFREVEATHQDGIRSAGNVETWRTRVLLTGKNKIVGTGALACIQIDDLTSVRQCTGTYILPRGRIQVSGQIINRRSFQMTIVGGTGVYTGAGGTAVFIGGPTALITFFLE